MCVGGKCACVLERMCERAMESESARVCGRGRVCVHVWVGEPVRVDRHVRERQNTSECVCGRKSGGREEYACACTKHNDAVSAIEEALGGVLDGSSCQIELCKI